MKNQKEKKEKRVNEQIEHSLFILKGMCCEKLLDPLLRRKKTLCFNITQHSNVEKTLNLEPN